VTDSIYAAEVANGTYRDGTFLESMWPAGALCIAAAAWMDIGRDRVTRNGGDRVVEVLTGAAITVCTAILFADHFVRVDALTLGLCAVTILTAVFQRAVSPRDRAEARAAVDAAERLRGASAEAAMDCIVSIDQAGRVSDWNDAAVRTFGYSSDDAVGKDLAELIIPPEVREQSADVHGIPARHQRPPE
jgi:PAS domain-containing protein